MFGIGIQEALLILAVALLAIGPAKLPGFARTLGKGLRELRKASDDLRSALMFDDEDEASRPRRRGPSSPAAVPSATAANAAPGIHGSLTAGAGELVAEEDGPLAVPADPDAIVSRGETGGDPHKRALDPLPRDDGPPRHEPFTSPADVPADPDATALLDEGRRQRDEGDGARAAGAGEKDATT